MRLTKTAADAATFAGGTDYRWDDALPCFGLRIYPSGRKAFVVSYRYQRRKKIKVLGRYGVLTVDQARRRAREVLAEVTLGHEPSTSRNEASDALPTFADLAERYLRDHAIPKKKPKSAAEDKRMLEATILPAFGTIAAEALSRDDISRLHSSLGATPYKANRVLALLRKACNLAEAWGWRPDGSNPCRHVQPFKEKSRERFLSAEELGRLGVVLNEAEESEVESPVALAAIRLLLLTGCRKSEILSLRWEEVDLERQVLFLPDSKTGAKVVPLGRAAVDVLEHQRIVQGNPYVFPGRGGKGHLIGLQKIWERIRESAELPDVRLHDLRHSFASAGAGVGMGLPIIGKILGHADPGTTARYAHLATDPLVQAADQISKKLAAGLGEIPSPLE